MSPVPRITGGGIPEIAEDTDHFRAPLVVHEGYDEPRGVA
jgi:hypothetical protein